VNIITIWDYVKRKMILLMLLLNKAVDPDDFMIVRVHVTAKNYVIMTETIATF
jgi:hypothetical protein